MSAETWWAPFTVGDFGWNTGLIMGCDCRNVFCSLACPCVLFAESMTVDKAGKADRLPLCFCWGAFFFCSVIGLEGIGWSLGLLSPWNPGFLLSSVVGTFFHTTATGLLAFFNTLTVKNWAHVTSKPEWDFSEACSCGCCVLARNHRQFKSSGVDFVFPVTVGTARLQGASDALQVMREESMSLKQTSADSESVLQNIPLSYNRMPK
eukprot:192134-Rhodomonas_salina.1